MNHLTHSIALHPDPRREVSLKRSGVIPPKPGAVGPIAVLPRRRSLPRVLAAWSVRRHSGRPPGPGRRTPAGSGVGPIASGATRGIAFLVER